MAQRNASHHRNGPEDRRRTGESLSERAAALRLATTLGDGPLRDALIGVAAQGSQVVAEHPRLAYNETSRGGKVGGAALLGAALIENPALLDGGQPPDDIVQAVGGLGTYYTLLEECAAIMQIAPSE